MRELRRQQRATSDILRAISTSPTDLQSVLDSLANNAARLCDAKDVLIFRVAGDFVQVVAHSGRIPINKIGGTFPILPEYAVGTAVLARRVVHVRDLAGKTGAKFPGTQSVNRPRGVRTLLVVPLLRDGAAIGVISMRRQEVRPFSAKQIKLVRTFADQAVIALENTRLFEELDAHNKALTEALEQQTATSEILRVISSSPTDLQPVLNAIAESAALLSNANDAVILQVEGDFLKAVVQYGQLPSVKIGELLPIRRTLITGTAILDRRTMHIHDAISEEVNTEFPDNKQYQERIGYRTILITPLMREDSAIGVIAIRRMEVAPFSDKQIELIRTFADQAVIAIENVRLFKELEERNKALTEALEQQTATSEILRVISGSPKDTQPVFATILASATRLCEATFGTVMQVTGDRLVVVAHHNLSSKDEAALDRAYPQPLDGGSYSGRAVLTRSVIQHIHGVESDPTYPSTLSDLAQEIGFRATLQVPMLKAGGAIGVLSLWRRTDTPFSEQQIELLKTFADQAVIAIENVRLFTELQEQLEQQTATSEILRVISQSQRDVQPVFEAIAANAQRLCRASSGWVNRFDGEFIEGSTAYTGATHEALAAIGQSYPMRPNRGAATGRAILTRAAVYVPDVREDPEYRLQSLAQAVDFRSIAAAPMIRNGSPIGAITVLGAEPAMFSERQVVMLQTFADQAVIAIENVRLFNELEERNKALTEALEQQTATSEILRVISQSQRDVQPVFETIVANARKLGGTTFAVVFRFDGNLIHIAALHGSSPERLEEFRRTFPMPVSRRGSVARAILTRTVVYIPDVREDPEYRLQTLAEIVGYRSTVAVPMLLDGKPIGAITVGGAEPAVFSDRQIAMLQTFADQAVIAIENTRLFKELEERNTSLTEALEQQTATSEILRVISQSQRDVQPVFEAIAGNARRLCKASWAVFYTFDGELIRYATTDGMSREAIEATHRTFPMPPSRGSALGRAILTRAIAYIPDVREDAEYRFENLAQTAGYRSTVSVPILHNDRPIGAISVYGTEPSMFSERQIAMLQTFADQAVIAIENVRLFTELEERNKSLTEALEQQTATSEILRVISSSPTDLQPVLDAVSERAAKLCAANDSQVFLVEGDALYQAAAFGPMPPVPRAQRYPITRGLITGRAMIDGRTIHVEDAEREVEAEFPDSKSWQAQFGYRTILATPLLRQGVSIGAIVIRRLEVRRFTDKQIDLLKTFADQAVIAIENTRLFKELQERLEQQTATSEILRVISQSQSNVLPVFETIAASARKLCAATNGMVGIVDGSLIRFVAGDSISPDGLDAMKRAFPRPLSRDTAAGRAILTRVAAYIPDIRKDPDYALQDAAQEVGYRSIVSVPMIREGNALGMVAVTGAEPAMITERQIAMLQTFADQAVIAIENTRLFNELQARTADLSRSVEELKALGEVGAAVSSTLDLDTVLTTILTHANKLAGTQAGQIFDYDEATEELRPRATIGYAQNIADALRGDPLRKGEGVTGQAVAKRQPVQVADIAAEDAYASRVRDLMIESGFRAVLAVPLIREDEVMGALTVVRTEPGEFPQQVVDLLTTFASQSALAMQNARLFHEIEQKSHELEIASQHKSQFLANMSHELRTPLNAILGYTELIADQIYGPVPEKILAVLDRVEKSGRHLLGLINDVLDLSKIEAGQLVLSLADYSFSDVVQAVASAVGSLAAEKRLPLEVDVAPDLPVGRGDERRITQVLLNLVGNAIKFTDAGEIAVRVTTREGLFVVSVADTGPGIREEDRQKIFEEFQQSDSSPTKTKGGTGLGLAIAKRIVEMHGGRIWVESTVGKGSTFFFSIPVRAEVIPGKQATAEVGVGTGPGVQNSNHDIV